LLDLYKHSYLEYGEVKIRFYPNGTTEEFDMVLQGPNGEIRHLWLDPVTGTSDWESK